MKIIVDSLCDITQDEAAALGIWILPGGVSLAGESFLDGDSRIDGASFLEGVPISSEALYERMEQCKELPKTTHVTPEAYIIAFQKAFEAGEDTVLCITGSSILSGTFQSVTLARSMQSPELQARIHIFDSMTGTIGEAILVYTAQLLNARGKALPDILQALDALKPRIRTCATIGDLKYLVMGGRLPKLGASVGTLLHLSPVVHLADGQAKMAGVCRGKHKVLDWFANELRAHAPDPDYPMVFGHAHAIEQVAQLQAEMENRSLTLSDKRQLEIGSVVGSHIGPGSYGVAWVMK